MRLPLPLLFILLASSTVVYADDIPMLTWPAAVKMAAQQNPKLASALKSLAASESDLARNWNGVLPQANLGASYSESKSDGVTSHGWNVGGSASLDIFNMSRYADIASARAALAQSQASMRLSATNVLFSLRSAFVSLLYAQAQDTVSQTIKELRDSNARMVTLRYQSGRESKGNMLRANAEQLQAEAELTQAQRNIVASQQEFSHQMGWDQPKVMIATGTLNLDATQQAPRDVIAPLVEQNPSVSLAFAQLNSANSALRRAESDLWPNLSVTYSRNNTGPSYFPDNPSWIASGNLNYPIFGQGPTATFNAVSSARRLREAAVENLREARNQVRSDLESTWADLANAIDDIRVQEAFLTAARQRNDEADIRYTSGLMSYEDWELIVSDRVNYERSVITARRDAMIALAQWNKSSGMELGSPQ